MKHMTVKQYFQVIHPKYVILKLTPDTSIRNYNSSNIAKTIQYMYRSIWNRIRFEEKHFAYETEVKCSFFIDIRKQDVQFYFVVPMQYEALIKEKVSETWPKVTIEVAENIEQFTQNAVKYQLKYNKEDALSLNLNKKCNEPLNSILNVLDIMQEGDRVGVFYNFIPCSQLPWRNKYNETTTKIKQNKPIDREKFSWKYIIKEIVILVLDLLQDILDTVSDFMGNPPKKNEPSLIEVAYSSLLIEDRKKLSPATVAKKDSIVISTQIVVTSDSASKERKQNNAVAVMESYKTISEDNELIYRKIKNKVIGITDYKINGAEENMMSVDECQNLLEIPGRDMLKKYVSIKKIDVLESPIPPELQKGTICIGDTMCKGSNNKAYLSSDKDYKNLTLCLIGPTRAGKTTLISNIASDAVKAGECTILFDFCGNCELSNDVSKAIDNVLNIDCSDPKKMQGLGYNEIIPAEDNNFEVYRCAKTKTSQLMTFVNSINADDSELRARMERYLEASAVIVFIQNGSIKNVFEVLQDYKIREQFIKSIPKEHLENLQEYINAMEEIDEWSKETKDKPAEKIGTKMSNIQGIINRISKLKQNTYMELMLKKDCENNINLIEEMQKSQLICIRMPEIMFSTEQEKDIYCTYWLTKIWGSLQVRKWNVPEDNKRVKVNIVFDELYQVPCCQNFLRSKLSQIAKFSCKPIISCHYLGQIALIRNELKAANSSYILISGCDKDNFKELKEELEPYQLEDLLNMKRYYSMNLIKCEGGWAKFITKLPPPIR